MEQNPIHLTQSTLAGEARKREEYRKTDKGREKEREHQKYKQGDET